MPCYQSTNLPSGVTTSGRTAYQTESDCNQACKEGACCEGTTCSVKPQCQCQCTTGRCCGPDTITVRPGESYPAYRVESREACLARGGTWRCGAFGPQSIEGYVGSPVCPAVAGTPEPVFKGVGTTCANGPCDCKCATTGSIAPAHMYATFSGGSPWDGVYVLDRMGQPGQATGDCYAAAGFNWAAWTSEGSIFRGRMGTCCTAYYAFLYGNEGYASRPADANTGLLASSNNADGWILITPDASSIVLPFRQMTVAGSTCWYSVSAYTGPTLLTGPGTYCDVGWSAVMEPSVYFNGGGQIAAPPGSPSVFVCPRRSDGSFIFPTYPKITFHA